ncbi:Alpha/Beta hydrolase protein [Melanogaster broomeanus]|nr:Alpha/Beta hydrolase protein [Melanogaster broomeanus]
MSSFSRLKCPDGTELAYEVLGSENASAIPFVFVVGMTGCRGDTVELTTKIALKRPVLIYDHRGMGDSTLQKGDAFTIETLARDLLLLIQSLGWQEVALCGHSMGGVIVQQLLFLPYHSTDPTPLPFRVTHVILASTLHTPIKDPQYGVKFPPRPTGPISMEQAAQIIYQSMPADFDPEWFADRPTSHASSNLPVIRPFKTIVRQRKATSEFNFEGLHSKLSLDIHFLIVHGELDQIVPFSYAQDFLDLIPWARMIPIGDAFGSIPHRRFGHNWMEYFTSELWYEGIEAFLKSNGSVRARL